jgi:hypothetical protein
MMGQEDETQTFKLTGISYDDTQRVWWAYFAATEEMYAVIEDVFPILRPLSDMTEEEHESYETYYMSLEAQREEDHHSICEVEIAAHTTQWLLSKSFDLFGLIDAGLAIDKTKLTNHGN